jgi:hypothetical protein
MNRIEESALVAAAQADALPGPLSSSKDLAL